MPKFTSDDILAHSITALKAFKEASSAISSIPALPAVLNVVLEIVETIENVKENKDLLSKLRVRVIGLGNDLIEDIADYGNTIDPSFDFQLRKILTTLEDVQKGLITLSRQRSVSRWMHRGSIKSKLSDQAETVEEMRHKYLRTMLSTLTRNALQQVRYTKDGHLYFRDSDLRQPGKRRICGGSSMYSEEMIARYEGGVVAVRFLRPGNSIEDFMTSTLTGFALFNNPNIARYLGRSHPNAARVFVVAEIGESTAGEYFESPHGTTVKLHSYLQMYIDWQDLTFYSRTMGLHIPPDEQFHTHSSECLSSLSFKQDGRFTVLAEDLQHTNVFCLQHHLITMLDKNFAGTSKARNEWNVELAAGSLSMMRVLEYEARPGFTDLDIGDLYKHRLPNIHSYHWVVQSTRVEVGDYAYKDCQQGHFVRLGNVSEILPCKRSVGWEDCMSIDGVLQTAAYNGASAECVWRVVLERNKCVQISFYGRLHDTDLQPFWWLYCRSAADYHGVALQQLVVVNTIAHSCNILIDVDLWDEGPDTLYFHRLPIMSNDEVPSPFGYWSFDREPSPGPWPDISIPGLKMQYRYEYRYTYLSALQAQLATCFSDCLWASCPPLPFPQRSAIDNTESFRSSGSHSPNTWSTHRGHDNDDDHSYCSDSASIVDDECYETADEYVDND